MKKIDHDERRQEIAKTAAKLIAEQGIDKLTVRLIAKSMDCSTGVLSHYFDSKDAIVLAALNWANEWVVDNLLSDYIHPSNLEDLNKLLLTIMPLTEENDLKWRVRISSWAYAFSREELTLQQLERTQNWQRYVAMLVRELQQKGLLSATLDADNTAVTLTNLIIGTSLNLLFLPMERRSATVKSIFSYLETLR